MKIVVKLSEFEENQYHRDVEVAPAELGLNDAHDPMRIEGPVRLTINAQRTHDADVLMRIPVQCHFVQQCVSCLDRVDMDVKAELTMMFSPAERVGRQYAARGGEMEDPDIASYSGTEIVLDDEIAGFLLQVASEYPRCRPDCKGLDPVTGENLNRVVPGPAPAVAEAEDMIPEWKRKLRELGGG